MVSEPCDEQVVNVLVLTTNFPPHSTAEAFLSAKALGALKAQGLSLTVLTLPPGSYTFSVDTSLNSFVSRSFERVVYVDAAPRSLPKTWSFGTFLKTLSRYFFVPDIYRLSHAAFYKKSCEILMDKSYSVLLTWSQYHSIHLVGLSLKKKFPRLRWVAHFSDPWTNNPYRSEPWPLSLWNKCLEKKVFHQADHLNVPSSELQEWMIPKRFHFKTSTIPHVFEESLYLERVQNEEKDAGRCVVRHLGSFYGKRSPIPFLEALRELSKKDVDLPKKVKIEFYGRRDPSQRVESCIRSLPLGLVTFFDPVSYQKSLALMKTADILLLIEGIDVPSIFFPSKLVDYIGAGRPILGLTRGGFAENILKKNSGLVADPSNIVSIQEALKKLLNEWQKKIFLGSPSIRENFSASLVSRQWENIIRGPNGF